MPSDERKPIITIRLPISCKTKENLQKAPLLPFAMIIDGMCDLLDWLASITLMRYAAIAFLAFCVFIAYSIPMFVVGGWIFGCVIGIANGHLHEVMSDAEFLQGGISGIIVGWIILALRSGFIKFSCVKKEETHEEEVIRNWGLQP